MHCLLNIYSYCDIKWKIVEKIDHFVQLCKGERNVFQNVIYVISKGWNGGHTVQIAEEYTLSEELS